MKPTFVSSIEHRLARHDRRARGQHALPPIASFYRQATDAVAGTDGQQVSGKLARRSFRQMMSKMMATQDKATPVEMIVYGCIIAVVAWPLIQLLITLAETAYG